MRTPVSTTLARACALALITALVVPTAALAHERRDVAGYQFVVGFSVEPAIEGVKNGVQLRVTQPPAADDAAGATGDDAASSAVDVEEHGVIFASPGLAPNDRFEWIVPEQLAGMTVPVHDHIHHELTGEISVMHDPSLPDAVTVEIDGEGFQPSELMVRPGSTVTFVNADSEPHSAISGLFAEEGHEHDDTSEAAAVSATPVPVEGLEETLQVEVTHVETSEIRVFELRAVFNDPGHYTADLIPTASGQYRFRFFGTIDGEPIDETFESGPGTFNHVEAATELQFPISSAQPRELEAGLRGASADAADAADDASGARTLAIAGIVLGALGLLAGAGGIAAGMRRR